MSYIKDFEHLKQIVQHDEQDDIEYKDEQFLINLDANTKIMKYVSGFANSEKGGSIIFGVSDKGVLIGIDKAKLDLYKRKISDWIRNGISGTVFYETYEISKDDDQNLFYLIIDIPRSNLAPHMHLKDYIYYKREGTSIGSLSTQVKGKYIPLSEREIYNLYKDRLELREVLKKREQFILENVILKFNGISPSFFFLIQPAFEMDNFLLSSEIIRIMTSSINGGFELSDYNKDYFGVKIKFKRMGDNGIISFLDKGELLLIRTIPQTTPSNKYKLDSDAMYISLGFFLKSYRSYYKKINRNPQISLKIGFVNPENIILPNQNKLIGIDINYIIEGIDCKDYSNLDEMACNLFEKVSHWFGVDSFVNNYPKIKSQINESKDSV